MPYSSKLPCWTLFHVVGLHGTAFHDQGLKIRGLLCFGAHSRIEVLGAVNIALGKCL